MEVYIPADHVSVFLLHKPEPAATNEVGLVNNGPSALDWFVAEATQVQGGWQLEPAHDSVPPATTQVISLTAFSANLPARTDPYAFNFTFTGENVCACDNERSITLQAFVFVDAALDAARSAVALTHAAHPQVRFTITPRDGDGVAILDDHELLFVATLTHDDAGAVSCTVAYDREFEFSGTCVLPFVESRPAVGDFELAVYWQGDLIGGTTTTFTVHRCPEEFYYASYTSLAGAASCEPCPADAVSCTRNSTLAELELRPGKYRLNRLVLATHIRTCPNARSCKGGAEPGDASCAKGFTSTLCARCAPQFFRAGAACVSCSSSRRWANSWGWFGCAVVLLVAAIVWTSRRMPSRAVQLVSIYMENFAASCGAMPKIIFSGAQIMASYPSHIATDALPEKFRSFLSSLDFTTFNIISAVRVAAQPLPPSEL